MIYKILKTVLLAAMFSQLLLIQEVFSAEEKCTMGKSKSFSMHSKQGIESYPNELIPRCSKEGEKFLLIRIGVKSLNKDGTGHTNYFEDIPKIPDLGNVLSKCRLKNPPEKFTLQNEEDYSNHIRKKRRVIEECIRPKLIANGRAILEYPKDQPFCQIEKIDEQSAYFRGSRCLFNRDRTSSFQVTYETNSNCLDEAFIREKNLNPGDLNVEMDYYLVNSKEESEIFQGSKIIGSSSTSFTLVAPDSLFSLSENDYGPNKLYPNQWVNPKFFPGKLEISKSAGRVKINLPIFGSNICPNKCVEGICSSLCNFNIPFTPKFKIYHLKDGKKETLFMNGKGLP